MPRYRFEDDMSKKWKYYSESYFDIKFSNMISPTNFKFLIYTPICEK